MVSCTEKPKQHTAVEEVNQTPFTLPELPLLLTDPQSQLEFIATNYWQNFPFSDASYTNNSDLTEQAIVDFLNLATQVEPLYSQKGIESMFKRAHKEANMLPFFWKTVRHYWNNPNSPMQNEAMHLLACQAIKGVNKVDEAVQIQATYDFTQLSKNQIGKRATDIQLTYPSGKVGRLYDIAAEHTILYFYNPTCESCQEKKEQLIHATITNQLLTNKELKIVAIYPDENIEEWHSHLVEMPKEWVHASDPQQIINKKQTYYLQAIPTLYLLDKEKKVVLKDGTVEEIEALLKNK